MVSSFGIRLLLGCAVAIAPTACGDESRQPEVPPAEELCALDDDCAVGRCDPRRGCVDCLFDHDCAAGERCDERACREVVACDVATDCSGASYPVCDLDAGECVACLEAADCGGNAHCIDRRCEPYEACSANDDCVEGVCDTLFGHCVECTASADCGGERACVDKRCVTPCARERDCPSDVPVCGPAGYCVECAVHTHCPDVYHCAEGTCALDVCENAETRCQSGARGVETCTASGSGFLGTACNARQSCTSNAGDPECVDWICEPESERCGSGADHVELCSADGLEIASRVNCAERDETCVEGACVAPICEAGEAWCEDGVLYRCSGDGTTRELERTCSSDERCDAVEATCIPLVCVPSMLVCDGDSVRTCNDDGTAFAGDPSPCEITEACFDGACLPRVCVGDYLCDGDESRRCLDGGTRLELDERCSLDPAAPTYCNPDTGRCELVGCDASQPICSGNVATVCADDGSAPVAGGIDCEDIEEVCFGGSCLPEICTEEYVCQQGDLFRCEDNGSALRLSGECGRPELCDANAGLCLPEVCTPGDPICNGTLATTCDETGAGYEPGGIDCSESDQACHEGACAPVVCDAAEHLCVDGDVHLCNPSGTASVLVDDCSTGEHCTPGVATCDPNACSPGAGLCVGTIATQCREDGSGPENGGTNCADTGEACRSGACEPLVCVPDERFCSNGHVRLCNGSGTASAPYDDCIAGEYCDDTDTAACRPQRCAPNDIACSGETLAVCNNDGSGYVTLGTNCAANGNVCDLINGCSASASDVVGSAELYAENPMPSVHLTVLEVVTSRTLTEIRSYFAVTSDTNVVWLVYEALEGRGTYQKLFEHSATVVAGAATFHDSGEISAPLQAGRYYAVGVLVQGPHTEYRSATAAAPLSFAAVVGSSRSQMSSAPEEIWLDVAPGGMGFQGVMTE
jgi:hypothetical protein